MFRFPDFIVETVVYPAGRVMPRHDHRWTNVTAVIRGEMLEETPAGEHRGRSCSVVVKPAGTVHANRFIGPGPVSTIHVELRSGSELARLAAAADWTWIEGGSAAHTAFQLHRAMRLACSDIEASAQRLLATVLTPRMPLVPPPWFGEVCATIERRADQPVRLDELAGRVGLHPVYISRAFRRITGTTMTAYIRDLRLGRARHLLSTTERPLAVIAANCGFTDASHLSRTFAAAHSVTPGAFRQICNARG
ncbi:MAG TPA: helix-turn-helix domain-containing protein [Longimicrobiales bacterium]|nr:helix-turn-helix domain-containing protein [Longimicrobiales bacterium]